MEATIDWVEVVSECFRREAVLYSGHARGEMLVDEFGPITDGEVGEAAESAELLEEYLDDRPYPSCLLLSYTKSGRALHLVAAYDEAAPRVILITVYRPDPARWEDDRRRKL